MTYKQQGGPLTRDRPKRHHPDDASSIASGRDAEPSRRDVALDYAARGLCVFPCRAGGKTPLTAHGCLDASSHREHVWHWWRHWPLANIGVATGPGSGWFVVDLDGAQGRASWERLTDRHGQVSTLVQITGGLGLHLVFAYPDGLELANTAKALAPGIDTRGAGGYIIVAPSVHPSGRPYRWLEPERKPAPLPGWLLELLLPPRRQPSTPRAAPAADGDGAELVRWVARQPEGRRNDSLNWAACRALDRYGDDPDLLDRLVQASVVAGLTEREARRTIQSARRYKGHGG